MNKEVLKAKKALDALINKSRVHLYKPIQIGEILYHSRVYNDVNLDDLESYRNKSKHWRNEMTKILLGRVCTSSARFQDDLFNETAIPPKTLKVLAIENKKSKGAVEAYIYSRFISRQDQLSDALNKCINATKETFYLKNFINSFWTQPGLKRSLDKIYEIIVYSLFSTLVEALKLQTVVCVDSTKIGILTEFEDFAKMVMCLDAKTHTSTQDAKVFRVGITNAADRGLDMYSNWGPAIQIKHLSLDVELAQSIVTNIASDRVVIVCKDAEKKIIVSLLTQIGWKSKIQSIITEKNLISWYEKALRGKYANSIGNTLLKKLRTEIAKEFPSIKNTPQILRERHYELIKNTDWAAKNQKQNTK